MSADATQSEARAQHIPEVGGSSVACAEKDLIDLNLAPVSRRPRIRGRVRSVGFQGICYA